MSGAWRHLTKESGQSLVEVIFALGLFALLVVAVSSLIVTTFITVRVTGERHRAVAYAVEAVEAARSIAESGWGQLLIGSHGLTTTSSYWQLSGSSDSPPPIFSRVLKVEKVYRDGGGDIVWTGGTLDPLTKKVTSTVTWNVAAAFPRSYEIVTLFTHFGRFAFQDICEPVETGTEGCSHGYWKNHQSEWSATGYSTTDDFDTVFSVNAFTPDKTLLQTLSLGGGGVNGLARQATAALLNAAHPDVDYPLTVSEVTALVQAALATGGDIEGTKDQLEEYNELNCPFDCDDSSSNDSSSGGDDNESSADNDHGDDDSSDDIGSGGSADDNCDEDDSESVDGDSGSQDPDGDSDDGDGDDESSCQCDGGIRVIKLQTSLSYSGGTVTVEARAAKKDKLDSDPYGVDSETFTGTTFTTISFSGAVAISRIESISGQAVIEFIVDAALISKDKFDSSVDFRVSLDGEENEVRIHTSCSQPIAPPFIFSDFKILSFTDKNDQICNPESPECGNGTVESEEQCDDGNTIGGDGCSDTCQLEGSSDSDEVVCELKLDSHHNKVKSIHIETTNTDPNLNSLWAWLWGLLPGTSNNLILQQDADLVWPAGVLEMGGTIKAELKNSGSQKKLKLTKDGSSTTFVSGGGGLDPQLADGGWHEVQIEQLDNVEVEFDTDTIVGRLKKLKVKLKANSTDVDKFELEIIGVTSAATNNSFSVTTVKVMAPETRLTAYGDRLYKEKQKSSPSQTNGHIEAESKSDSPALGDLSDLEDSNNNSLKRRDGACQIEGAGVCGNGVIEGGEQCDDGNTTGGDGCSSNCQLEDNACPISPDGTFVSDVFDATFASIFESIEWSETVPPSCSPVCDILMQIRTATTLSGLATAEWSGPDGVDGDETDYFTNPAGETIHSDHDGDQYLQYRATFIDDGTNVPQLNSVTIFYFPQ